MNEEIIEDIGNDIAGQVRDEANKGGKLAENVTSASKTFLETQLDTFTELTNIVIEGTEKMVELNVAAAKESIDGSAGAVKELLSKNGNTSNEKMESSANEGVDAAKTNVAKATDQVEKIVKKSTGE